MSFLSNLQSVYSIFSNQSSNSTKPVCDSAIDHYLFYNWMLLPSGLTTIFLACFIKRKTRCPDVLGGRPGLLYPLNIFTLENRFTLAAAYGSISFILADIVLEAKYAIPFSGQIWLRIFVILGSVLIYGIVYFPLFAGLATRSLIGYAVSSSYAWMFAIIDLFKTFECELDVATRMLLIVRNIPKLVASLFLAISLTVLIYTEVRKYIQRSEKVSHEVKDFETAFQQVRDSHYGKHVRALFLPPPPPSRPKEGCFGRIYNIIRPFVHKWIYHRKPNFLYPARVIAIYTACFFILYKVTCEILIIFVPIIEVYQWEAGSILEELGLEPEPGEDETVTSLRGYMYVVYYWILVIKGCLITATCLAFLLGVLMTIHSLSSYRVNLLALFRGDHTVIPGREEKSNVNLLVSTIRYAGYQIAYTSWAYVVQWTIFFILAFVVATVITMLAYGYADIIVSLIRQFWPAPVSIIVMLLFQMLITKFLFTQENGDVFGITNRRGFFIFAYFMFFYNIFIGLISCLLRILKGMGVGALLLGRLDQSTLSRKWQWFDPGFDAYLGFIHAENYQMNPIVHVFIEVLRIHASGNTRGSKPSEDANIEKAQYLEKEETMELEIKEDVAKKQARFNWHLAYSLHNNPQLRAKRKHYLDQLKAKMEITYKNMDGEKKDLEEEKKASIQNGATMYDVKL